MDASPQQSAESAALTEARRLSVDARAAVARGDAEQARDLARGAAHAILQLARQLAAPFGPRREEV